MTIKELDTIALTEDLPSHELKKGDLGAIVGTYTNNLIEVEFVTASGRTQALITISADKVRPVGAEDILAVRSLNAA